MKYQVAIIDCKGLAEWQVDVLQQELADVGFDSFEQDGTTLRAYIPQSDAISHWPLAISQELRAKSQEPAIDARLLSMEACADENWNAVWEASHEVEQLPLGVRITPHCAFGAGHHETTAMMIDALVNSQQPMANGQQPTILDMGTGTGVLAIMAAKLGAKHVVAVDIDENSVRNAQENAAANGVKIDVRLGANVPNGAYDLIMANIHRNILLNQLPDYARTLNPGGELWLSGFYESDCEALIRAAVAHGLHHSATRQNGEWRMLVLGK